MIDMKCPANHWDTSPPQNEGQISSCLIQFERANYKFIGKLN